MENKPQLRQMGQTDISITPIGLGVMQFAGGKGLFSVMFPEVPTETKTGIIKAAWEGGINWFDTAEMYGFGRSESALAAALKANNIPDQEVIIHTKWMPFLRRAVNMYRTIETRLRCLGGYTIDLYMIHQPWSLSSPEQEMDVLADLVEQGKIRTVGVSNFSAADMERAAKALEKRGLSLAINQVQYSLLHRNIEKDGTLQAAKDLGVNIVSWSPLGSGILSGKFHKDPQALASTPYGRRQRMKALLERTQPLVEVLDQIAVNHAVTPSQVALNWLVNFHGETVVAIPGASKVSHAAEAAGVMDFKLTDEEMARLDEISRQ